MTRFTLAAALALLAAAAIAAPALADDAFTPIPGSPMTVYVGARGQLQAVRSGDQGGIFFPTSSTTGDAGFFLAFPAMTGQNINLAGKVFGFTGHAGPYLSSTYTVGTQLPVTGDGSAGAPFRQVTTYTVNSGATIIATITQTTTYFNGAQDFRVRWDVKNNSAQALPYKALAAADFYFEGSDVGTGIFTLGPPRFIGGTNADTGRSGGFVEVPEVNPWSSYQALEWRGTDVPDVWADVVQNAAGSTTSSFDGTVAGQSLDNAGGVEWDQALITPLAAGQTAHYELLVRSALPAAIQFDKTNAGAPQRTPITFVATAKDTSGQPFSGKALRYAITGANPGSGASVVDAAGNAAITDPGANAGPDTIIAYLDLNNDAQRQPNEPQASTLATFVDNIPPTCIVKVTGDRPGGGGAGKPLVITVNCDSPATVTTVSTFTIKPKKKAKSSAKPKKVVVKLPKTTAQVLPGQAIPVSIKVSKKIAKKYAGATVTAKVVVTATDGAGNKASKTATRTVKLRAVKTKKKKG
jgi:hypothetical protein